MTTRIQIKVAEEHAPIVIDVTNAAGEVMDTFTLKNTGDEMVTYVHSDQCIRIREAVPAK